MAHLILTPENRIGIVGGYAVTSEGGAPCCCGGGPACPCDPRSPVLESWWGPCGEGPTLPLAQSAGLSQSIAMDIEWNAECVHSVTPAGGGAGYVETSRYAGNATLCFNGAMSFVAITEANAAWSYVRTGAGSVSTSGSGTGAAAFTPGNLPNNTSGGSVGYLRDARFPGGGFGTVPVPWVVSSPGIAGVDTRPPSGQSPCGFSESTNSQSGPLFFNTSRSGAVTSALSGGVTAYAGRIHSGNSATGSDEDTWSTSSGSWTVRRVRCDGGIPPRFTDPEHDCVGCGGRPMFG